MIAVPAYIEPYANNIKIKKNVVSFSLRCHCGCEKFCLIKNQFSDIEIKQKEEYAHNLPQTGWHTIYGGIDKDGKPFQYIKILGIFKKYFVLEPEPVFVHI